MGGFLINAFVRSEDQGQVVKAITDLLPLRGQQRHVSGLQFAQALRTLGEQLSQGKQADKRTLDALWMGRPGEEVPLAYVSPSANGWVGIFPDGGDPEELARTVSRALKSSVLSFEIHDGDYLQYWLFQDGEPIDHYHSCPGYFGESFTAAERRKLRGNAAALAASCNLVSASERLKSLLADPPSDAFALLDEIGELLQISNSQLKYDDLADPVRLAQVSDGSQYRPITGGGRRTVQIPLEPPAGDWNNTSQRDEHKLFLQQLQARAMKAEAAEAKRRARLERMRDPAFGVDYPAIHPNVVGSLVTFANHNTPQGRQRLIEAFLEMRQVLGPLIPRGFKLRWEYIYSYRGSFSSKSFRSSKVKDTEVMKLLESEEVRSVELAAEDCGPWVLACEFTPIRPGWPTAIAFSYDPKCCSQGGMVTPKWQSTTVDLMRDLTVRTQAACGYLSLDQINISDSVVGTPYEYLVNAVGDNQFTRLNTTFRGYFWGNVLGPDQVNRLGGLESVLAHAPCMCVPFPEATGPWVYLQVSDDINEYGDDALRRLRSFLSPILPAGPMDTRQARRFRLLYD